MFLKNFIYLKNKYQYSFKDLSVKSSIPKRTLEDIVYKKVGDPHISTVFKLCKLYNLKIEELFFNDLALRDAP